MRRTGAVMEIRNVLLVGAGRLAFHLGHAFKRAGLGLHGVVARDPARGAGLGRELGAAAFTFQDKLPPADVIVIAVRDDAIAEVSRRLPQHAGMVIHTSGAKHWDLIQGHAHRGVLWPIQSFSPGAPVDLSSIPLAIDAEDGATLGALRSLSEQLSTVVVELPHERRELVHAAAVFASNFPVFLLTQAEKLLDQQGLPPSLLRPIWNTSAANAAVNASQALTGPARRGDLETLQAHLSRLSADPDLRRAYSVLSDLVLKAHHPELRRAFEDLQGDPR